MSDKPTIYEVFAEAKRNVRAVGKDSENTQQHFSFRGIDAVVNAVAPVLDRHGVITAPTLADIEYATVEVGQRRTPMAHVRVKVAYRFYGPAGDHLEVLVPGEAMDSGDKATAKAMSVAYRIALLQGLNLPTSDRDPDQDSYERSPQGESEPEDGPGGVVVTDGKWLDEVKPQCATFKTNDEGSTLWRRVLEKAEAGGCTFEDKEELKELIRARHGELATASGKPVRVKTAYTPEHERLVAGQNTEDRTGKKAERLRRVPDDEWTTPKPAEASDA